jgi:hypothetical protein
MIASDGMRTENGAACTYSSTTTRLAACVKTLGKLHYQELQLAVENARSDCEQARQAYKAHLENHGC